MQVLLIAPPHTRVSRASRGPGQDIALLAEELRTRGHAVTVFTSEETDVNVPVARCSLPQEDGVDGAERLARFYAVRALAAAGDFDVVHSFAGAAVAARAQELGNVPLLVSLADTWTGGPAPVQRWSAPYTTASWAQAVSVAGCLPDAQFAGVAYPPLEIDGLPFEAQKDDYLLWLGPVSPAWGADLAIAAARKGELPLKLVGPAVASEAAYFQREVAPFLDGRMIEYRSAVPAAERTRLIAQARGLLLTPRCEPAWCRAAAEALAIGTPVVALDHAAARELIAHAETGYIGADLGDIASSIDRLDRIRAVDCRRRAERLWGVRIYEHLRAGRPAAAAIHPELTALELEAVPA
jgi:glycosyltransferase involved in cell wall biosynthesis